MTKPAFSEYFVKVSSMHFPCNTLFNSHNHPKKLPFTEEEIEAQRGHISCPRSHSGDNGEGRV